jgi:hypothetical protein
MNNEACIASLMPFELTMCNTRSWRVMVSATMDLERPLKVGKL